MEKFISVLSRFLTQGDLISCEKYGNGHINDTYLASYQTECGPRRYILQRINTSIFQNVGELMENIERVTTFLKENTSDPRSTLTLIPTREGAFFLRMGEGAWRMYDFVEDSLCIERPESKEDFFECGKAFGEFQKRLATFPAKSLHAVLPDFHNTPKRYRDFLRAVKEDVCKRRSAVEDDIRFVMDRADFYPFLLEAEKEGTLPLRVSHNDTKCNNVLLNKKDRKGLCVIDLDTVMPGYSVTDFGDAIRFGANRAAEDLVDLDLDLYAAYVKGFLLGCGTALPEEELSLLPEGAKMMTLECGMRFLADYLQGDVYFKTAYPEHNLVRFRTQRRLVEKMEEKWDEMKRIVMENRI